MIISKKISLTVSFYLKLDDKSRLEFLADFIENYMYGFSDDRFTAAEMAEIIRCSWQDGSTRSIFMRAIDLFGLDNDDAANLIKDICIDYRRALHTRSELWHLSRYSKGIKAYRGAKTLQNALEGYSWTSNEQAARWFACRLSDGFLVSAIIHPVAFIKDDAGEIELIAPYGAVKTLSIEDVKHESVGGVK